jgi:hypothetical protein
MTFYIMVSSCVLVKAKLMSTLDWISKSRKKCHLASYPGVLRPFRTKYVEVRVVVWWTGPICATQMRPPEWVGLLNLLWFCTRAHGSIWWKLIDFGLKLVDVGMPWGCSGTFFSQSSSWTTFDISLTLSATRHTLQDQSFVLQLRNSVVFPLTWWVEPMSFGSRLDLLSPDVQAIWSSYLVLRTP